MELLHKIPLELTAKDRKLIYATLRRDRYLLRYCDEVIQWSVAEYLRQIQRLNDAIWLSLPADSRTCHRCASILSEETKWRKK